MEVSVPGDEAAAQFEHAKDVVPFLQAYCEDCHSGAEAEGQIGFDRYRESSRVQEEFQLWEKVLRAIENRQMPPADAGQPAEQERQQVVLAIQAELQRFDCSLARRPGRVTIRRLNRVEYDRTVQDLFGLPLAPARQFPSDDVGYGFDNIADVLSIPPVLMEKYIEAAEGVVDQVFADEPARSRLLRHPLEVAEDASDEAKFEAKIAAFRRNIHEFAERAFRRPLTDEDRQRLDALGQAVFAEGASEEAIVKTVCTAILVSPHFLFRIENDPDPDDEKGIRSLNDWEVATRLSYFLWSSMPDDELFASARSGKLTQPDELRRQVGRMLGSPKSQALVDNFAGQWLQLRDVATRTPDPARFPAFDERLRDAMRQETELFFAQVMRENSSIVEFLNADYSYLNARLAEHYGLEGVDGEEFRRVALPGQRRGILTHASVLLITSNPTRTSPVKRGKWILENILGEPPPPPPPNVPELQAEADALGSLRERMEQHRENPACAVCHQQMDTLGFGMENFDAIGAWRDQDGRASIDPAGILPDGTEFAGPGELAAVLADKKTTAFARCLTEKLLTYALGRGLEPYDRCAVNDILAQLVDDDYRFHTLVTGIVLSEPFLKREAQGDR